MCSLAVERRVGVDEVDALGVQPAEDVEVVPRPHRAVHEVRGDSTGHDRSVPTGGRSALRLPLGGSGLARSVGRETVAGTSHAVDGMQIWERRGRGRCLADGEGAASGESALALRALITRRAVAWLCRRRREQVFDGAPEVPCELPRVLDGDGSVPLVSHVADVRWRQVQAFAMASCVTPGQ